VTDLGERVGRALLVFSIALFVVTLAGIVLGIVFA
jgi:hypothetical protein